MFKKLNTKTLLILFGILLAIVVLIQLIDQWKGERSFATDFEQVDTAKVTSIIITGKIGDKNKVKVFKGADGWKVESEGKTFNADPDMVRNTLNEIAKIKPERIAATEKSQWAQFEVTDSLGGHVIVKKDDKELADFVIGKFSYQQQPQKMTSYIRLAGDEMVYAVDGFLRMSFRNDADSYKNKNIVKTNKDDITKLVFTYPSDSSFTMTKQNNKWMVDGLLADSTEAGNYLSSLSSTSAYEFMNADLINKTASPVYNLKIEGNNFMPINVKVLPGDETSSLTVTSSANEGIYFSGTKSKLVERIFISKNKFLKKK